jgi:hypothetical protein
MGSGHRATVHVSYNGLVCNLIGCREENKKLHAQAVRTFLPFDYQELSDCGRSTAKITS